MSCTCKTSCRSIRLKCKTQHFSGHEKGLKCVSCVVPQIHPYWKQTENGCMHTTMVQEIEDPPKIKGFLAYSSRGLGPKSPITPMRWVQKPP